MPSPYELLREPTESEYEFLEQMAKPKHTSFDPTGLPAAMAAYSRDIQAAKSMSDLEKANASLNRQHPQMLSFDDELGSEMLGEFQGDPLAQMGFNNSTVTAVPGLRSGAKTESRERVFGGAVSSNVVYNADPEGSRSNRQTDNGARGVLSHELGHAGAHKVNARLGVDVDPAVAEIINEYGDWKRGSGGTERTNFDNLTDEAAAIFEEIDQIHASSADFITKHETMGKPIPTQFRKPVGRKLQALIGRLTDKLYPRYGDPGPASPASPMLTEPEAAPSSPILQQPAEPRSLWGDVLDLVWGD
jgi:hypothetical protein